MIGGEAVPTETTRTQGGLSVPQLPVHETGVTAAQVGGLHCYSLCPSILSSRLLGHALRAHINLKLASKGSAHGGMLANRAPSIFRGTSTETWSMPCLPQSPLAVPCGCGLCVLLPLPTSPSSVLQLTKDNTACGLPLATCLLD